MDDSQMYTIQYTKGGEKDRTKVLRSPYAETAMAIVEEIKRHPYSNGGGGLEKVNDGDIFYIRRISAKHRLVYQIDEEKKYSFGRCGTTTTEWDKRDERDKLNTD